MHKYVSLLLVSVIALNAQDSSTVSSNELEKALVVAPSQAGASAQEESIFVTDFNDAKTWIKDNFWTSPQEFLQDAALAYGIMFGVSTVHELGHVVAAKTLIGGPVTLNLGGHNKVGSVLSVFDSFFIRGFNPMQGYTTFRTPNSRLKLVLLTVAGPLFGGAAAGLALKSLVKKYAKFRYPLSKLMASYAIYHNLVGDLVPWDGCYNDGVVIYRAIKGL